MATNEVLEDITYPCTPPSSTEESTEEVDLPEFFWQKRKSLLDSCQYPPVSVQHIKHFFVNGLEDANKVEDGVDGFGPIHYIVTKDHPNKQDLIVCLVIHGMADVDLTTTAQSERTALHLSIKNGDAASVKTLISLGADVNKCDKLGNTPLDYAMISLKHPSTETDIPMVTLDRGETTFIRGQVAKNAGFLGTTEITKSQAFALDAPSKPKESEVTKYLKLVGAVHGRSKTKQDDSDSDLSSTSSSSSLPETKNGKSDCLSEDARINCQLFKDMEDTIDKMLKSMPKSPSSREAIEVVELLKKQEEYRMKCGSRILCLDGGGIRGLVQMAVLQEIERKTRRPITDLFDWIVGTSTGGIIALTLVYGEKGVCQDPRKTVLKIRSMYWQKKDEIFGKSSDGLVGFLGKGNTKELEAVLKDWLGHEIRLNQRSRPNVLIPAVQKVDTDLKLHFFNNCFDDHYSKELVWKVARYTSAAPFYFTEFENYIDGGILANNPAADALTKVQDHYRGKYQKLPISLLVSVGSGRNPPVQLGPINVHKNFLNPKAWTSFFDVVESALLNKSAHENCRSRCQEQGIQYFRFNPQLNETVDSDQKDAQKLLDMLFQTRVYLHNEKAMFDKLIDLLDQSELTTA